MTSKWEIYYSPSFLRIIKKLDPSIKSAIKETVLKVIDFYSTGSKTEGLGIKHLRNEVWEARSGLKIRVLYTLTKDRLTFVLAGSHDEVQRYL